ncbi:MAG TPA: SMP-30/gluconolactonase/LRE family protein [Steroidobacteraceae bacterium]|nr:SMP-30/gluconolactonase/LRE family protein [Steroidobacteraceae bacterium]
MAKAPNPLQGWQIDRSQIRYAGRDLQRPECVLAEKDGTLWSADARGGMMRINPDGTQQFIGQQADARFTEAGAGAERYILQGTLPNGVCIATNGDFIIANFGTNAVERMKRSGESRTLYTEIDGQPLGKTNFVLRDSKGRIWLTVTTRAEPWTRSINEKLADGYIALIDERGIRIVADGLVGTNEVRMDANEEWLYVVETNARRISRFRVQPDGSLKQREVFGPSKLKGWPDGFTFDAYGNLWMTYVLYDLIAALTPEGEELILLDDSNPAAIAEYERHAEAGTVNPEVMMKMGGTLAPWMASLTFGGPDLRTCYIGSLRGTTLPYFTAPVAGLPLAHWNETYR